MTLIRTPISAPDFAVLRLSIPATPAQAATKKVKKSGELMRFANVWFSRLKSSSNSPTARNSRVVT